MEFSDYVRARQSELIGFGTMLTGQPWLAEDLVADVLGKAFERWPHIAGVENPHAYVRRMVVNGYVDWRRRWARARPVADLGAYDVPVASTQAAHAARAEMIARLDSLPRKQRAAIVLRFYLDLPDAEIAEVLGCRPVTVRSHISKALRTLRIDLAADRPAALPAAPRSLEET